MLITTTIAFTILIIIAISWRYRYESALPVLKYHRVNTTTNDDITIHTDFFEQQLAYLAENGYRTIFMDEVYNYLYKSRHIPKKTIALTFDDGFLDNWVYAFPLLQKYNIKATIFLTTDYISNSVVLRKNTKTSKTPGDLPISHLSHDGFKSAFQGNPDNYLSWHEIKTMQSSGLVDFQSHTESHRHVFANNEPIEILRDADINNISYKLYSALEGRIDTITPIFKTGASIVTRAFHHGPAEYFESKSEYLHRLDKEIRNAKDIIETELDKTCKYLAWPWGEYNKYAIAKAKQNGFTMCLTTKDGSNHLKTDPCDIKRFTPPADINGFQEAIIKNSYLLPSWCVDPKLYNLFFKRRIKQQIQLIDGVTKVPVDTK